LKARQPAREGWRVNATSARLLIVDNEAENLICFEHLFEDKGFDTTTAWTGLDALKALLTRKPFDLVLVNDYLPDMDAEELMQRLHRVDRNVPCVVMQASKLVPLARTFSHFAGRELSTLFAKDGLRMFLRPSVDTPALICKESAGLSCKAGWVICGCVEWDCG